MSFKQKLILHESFWLPFPAALKENDLNVNLKNIIKSISKSDSLGVKIKTYLKSDVLSMLVEVLIALITEAKH